MPASKLCALTDADLKMLCSIPLTEYFPFRVLTPL